MAGWLDELRDYLARRDAAAMMRRLRAVESTDDSGRIVRRGGRDLINLSSNDYLGLSHHPALRAAAIRAIEKWGTGTGASRLAGGHLEIHERVETRFAHFKHSEAALLCPTGYMANLAVLTALAGPGDLICVDKLSHASLLDAARASGAEVRAFPHRSLGKLERLLERHHDSLNANSPRQKPAGLSADQEALDPDGPAGSRRGLASGDINARASRRFIVTDSVFSMDGDVADLPSLCMLADRHDAVLIVDEAHATGVFGETGAGMCELQGVTDRVDVVVSTASKALGGLGGIVTGPRVVIDTLVNRARSFIFTTAVPAAQAAAIEASLDVVASEPYRRARVLDLATHVHAAARDAGFSVDTNFITPIIPLVVGTPDATLALEAHLAARGLLTAAIRPPTVAPNACRVRVSLRADLTDSDVERLCDAIVAWQR